MKTQRYRSHIPVPVADLFEWHERSGAIERLIPPWQRVDIVSRDGGIQNGDILRMDFHAGPFCKRWVAVHGDYVHGESFRDTQVRGPFKLWIHTHRFHDGGLGESILDDSVTYAPPLEFSINSVAGNLVKGEIRRMFRYRHLLTRHDLVRHQRFRDAPRRAVAVLGTSVIAEQFAAFLGGGGHTIAGLGAATSVIDLRALDSRDPVTFPETNAGEWIFVHPAGDTPAPDTQSLRSVSISVPDVVSIRPELKRFRLVPAVIQRRLPIRSCRWSNDWIAEDDLIGLVYHAMMRDDFQGTVHAAVNGGAGDVQDDPGLTGFSPLYRSPETAVAAQSGRL